MSDDFGGGSGWSPEKKDWDWSGTGTAGLGTSTKYLLLAELKKQPSYPMAINALLQHHGQWLAASQLEVKTAWQESQNVMKVLYWVLFPGTQVSGLLDEAVPILGLNYMGQQEVPPIQLINKVGLRFCASPLPSVGTGDCCPPANPIQSWANRYYRRQLVSIAYAVLGGATWVEPLWDKHCQEPGKNSVAAKGCVASWPKPVDGNYFLQSSGLACFTPNPHPWVTLACCSPAAYKILAPINLSELVFLAEGGVFGLEFGMASPIATAAVWAMLARNIIIVDLINNLSSKFSKLTASSGSAFPDDSTQLNFASSIAGLLDFAAPAFGGIGLAALLSGVP